MRTIFGQIIATTGMDTHGESIPRDMLHILFEQVPDPWTMCVEHDPAKVPIARSYNKQFVQLENGNWAICADVDIFDEEAVERYGGFSIAFSTSTFTVNEHRDPEIEVTVNPRLIPIDEFCGIARQSTGELQVNVKDIVQKGLEIPALIFLFFATKGVAEGFFRSAGSDLYSLLKNKIKECGIRIAKQEEADLKCNMTFELQHRGRNVELLVSVRSADLDVLASRGITPDAIIDQINRVAPNQDLKRVVVRVSGSEPPLFIEYYTDVSGVVHRPHLPGES